MCPDSACVADVIVQHLRACKRVPALRYALPIIIPESNMPVALDIQREVKVVQKVHCHFMTEDTDRAAATQWDYPGSVTTRYNKPEMVRLLIRYMQEKRICFYEDFISVAEGISGVHDVQKEFILELRKFSKVKKDKKLRDGTPVCAPPTYNGKCVGANDDLPMALSIGVFMYRVFMQKEKYAELR